MHDPAFCRTFEFNIWEKLYMQICIARRQSEINNNVNFSCLLRHNRSPITCIHLDPYTLVTGLADGRVKIWNASSGNVGFYYSPSYISNDSVKMSLLDIFSALQRSFAMIKQ